MAQQNFVLGAGKLYFDPFDNSGNRTGERYLGDTPGFNVSVSTEKLEDYDSDGPVAEKIMDVATRVARDCAIVCKNIVGDNLALFIIGDVATKSLSAAPVTDEPHTVKKDRYYQLGQDATNPTGVRDITSVVVTGSGGTPTYAPATDYVVDLALGRLYITETSTIPDDTDLLVDYTTTVTSWEHVASNELGAKKGALRYVANNTEGDNRDLYAPSVQLRPDGELAFKSRDTVQQMTFAASFQKPAVGAAVYIDGRPV